MQQGLLADQQNAALDALAALHGAEARTYIAQCRALVDLDALSQLDEQTSGVPRFLVMEVAGSCRLGQQAAGARLVDADRVLSGLPLLVRQMEAGAFFVPQLRIVLAESRSIGLDLLRRVDAVVATRGLELASTDLRRLVRRTVLELESPDEAEDRLATARAGRRVSFRPEQDGMGIVSALLTAEQLRQFQVGLDQLERRERAADRAAGVDRTADQRRADLFASLPTMALSGEAMSGAQLGVVFNVHVPVATVLERGRQPGCADGYGDISAEHVRLLRPHASLRPVYVDAETGQPIQVGDDVVPPSHDDTSLRRVLALLRPTLAVDVAEPQHDPSSALARLVDARDRHCAGVGCSSTRCDRDHLVPYPEGPTAIGNLGLKSRRCHRAKHNGWTMVRHPDGSVTWTSPLGRRYSRPSPHVPPTAPQPRPVRPPRRAEQPECEEDDGQPPPF